MVKVFLALLAFYCLINDAVISAPVTEKTASTDSYQSCFEDQLENNSSNAQVLVCNAENTLSEEEVKNLEDLASGFPANSECEPRIFVSVRNFSSDEPRSDLISETGFVCQNATCCDTVAVACCEQDGHLFYSADLSERTVQKCRVQQIIQWANLFASNNNSLYDQLRDAIRSLTAEFRNPTPKHRCSDFKIDTTVGVSDAESVSQAPLIITVVLGVLILIVVVVLTLLMVGVCIARRRSGSGRPVFFLRSGKGEINESEPLGSAQETAPPVKTEIVLLQNGAEKSKEATNNGDATPAENDESAPVYNPTTLSTTE